MLQERQKIVPISFAELIEQEFPPCPAWIGPEVLPKSCKLIFGGGAGIGKSMMMLELARGLALGKSPFDYDKFQVERPVKVLIVEHELKPWGLHKRGLQMYKTKQERDLIRENIFCVSGETSLNFSSPAGIRMLHEVVGEVKPEVLFLDPIGKMHYEDENDNSKMAKLFHELDRLVLLGRDYGMSLIFSHHFGKPPKGEYARDFDPLDLYNFRGASKFKDDPDTRVSVAHTQFLPTPHKAWKIRTRWLTRQGEGPPDLVFTVNEKNDLRVRFVKEEGRPEGAVPNLPPGLPPSKPIPPPPGDKILTFPSV